MNAVTTKLGLALAIAASTAIAGQSGFHEYVTRKGNQLYEGDKPLRFISFNIPNLTYTEDDMQFSHLSNFRLPTEFEIEDALATIEQMGGRVARTYVLSVHKTNDPPDMQRHILAPDRLNESAMVMLDRVLEVANRRRIRLIIPIIDQSSWWGGIEEFAKFRGKTKEDFFTDADVKADYKRLVNVLLHRVNTRTGQRYLDDKAVLAWELGNELKPPKEWVAEMGTYFKQIDPKHLVAESYFTDPDNAGVDIVQDHLYQGDPIKMLEQVQSSLQRLGGRKVYLIGEFGFITTEGMRGIMDKVLDDSGISGALIWSLRYHNEDGGFYWHHEPWGSDFFKAYHWPGGPAGEPYDESRFMRIVRNKAYEIQGCAAPPLAVPEAPTGLRVTDGGLVEWQGSTGAAAYHLQRAENLGGRWQTVAYGLTDDATQYHPLAVDESAVPGRAYYYRLIAINETGSSKPSRVFGPVSLRCHTLVDEMLNASRTYRRGGKLEFKSNDARNYKEDCHRLLGSPGAWVSYHVPGAIKTVRVYSFGDQDGQRFEFRAGAQPSEGPVLASRSEDFFAGKDMYDFRPPRLDTIEGGADAPKDVLIEFKKEAQIGRIEIEYR
jgi:mannan endo-1,4-beta-mannosidase